MTLVARLLIFTPLAFAIGAAQASGKSDPNPSPRAIELYVVDLDVEICSQQDGEEALEACTRAIGSAVSKDVLPFLYNNRCAEYNRKNDGVRAISDCSEAIRLNPKFAVAYNNRGKAYAMRGEYERAIADCTAAIRLNPGLFQAYGNRGLVYTAKGEYDRAVADFSRAIALDPTFVGAYSGRGLTYAARGDYDRAMVDYNEAIKLAPKSGSAHFGRGRLYLYEGLLPQAVGDLDVAHELDPESAYVTLFLEIAKERSNLAGPLSREPTARYDMAEWPALVIRYYLGEVSSRKVFAVANSLTAAAKKGALCDARFYTAERELERRQISKARNLLRQAAAACPKNLIEYEGAMGELKRLHLAAPQTHRSTQRRDGRRSR